MIVVGVAVGVAATAILWPAPSGPYKVAYERIALGMTAADMGNIAASLPTGRDRRAPASSNAIAAYSRRWLRWEGSIDGVHRRASAVDPNVMRSSLLFDASSYERTVTVVHRATGQVVGEVRSWHWSGGVEESLYLALRDGQVCEKLHHVWYPDSGFRSRLRAFIGLRS